jgi:hypothetical protein
LANLNHPDQAIRTKATLALGDARRHRDWVPDLIVGVTEGSPDVRFWAALSLGCADPDPALGLSPLIAMLSDPDAPVNRAVAADALAKIGRPAASGAVPALARLLETETSPSLRKAAIRALRRLAVWNPDAISALIDALDDPDQSVRREAVQSLRLLGELARGAVAALGQLASSDEVGAIRSDASEAVERILSGAPPHRSDEPYRSLETALSKGHFSDPGVPDEIGSRLEQEDYDGAFELLAAKLAGEQNDLVWLWMSKAARWLERSEAGSYHLRFLESSGVVALWRELEAAIHSDCTVAEGMRSIISYCAEVDPDPRWTQFEQLPIDEDLPRLEAWLRAAFTNEPPGDDIPGLSFALIDLNRDGESSFDMHLEGGYPDDDEPDHLVIGGSWEPRNALANSAVLHEIHKLSQAEGHGALDDAEFRLTLAYGGLTMRWLAMTLGPELLLGGAAKRVLAVGFHDGDSIGVGTLRPDGLAFPPPRWSSADDLR